MQNGHALLVAAYEHPDDLFDSIVDRVRTGLESRRTVHILDLKTLGFAPRMSAAERRAYHTEQPIIDPMVAEHAALVEAATALVFVFPTRWWQPPAVLKAWVERVMVAGIAFVFDERHRVRPNLHQLQAIGGVTTYDMDALSVRRVGDGGRRMLLRALRANAPHRARTSWTGLFNEPAASPQRRDKFLTGIEPRIARL